jgi:hypothetical protein
MAQEDSRGSTTDLDWPVDVLKTVLVFLIPVALLGAAAAIVRRDGKGALALGLSGAIALAMACWRLSGLIQSRRVWHGGARSSIHSISDNEVRLVEGGGADRRQFRALGGRRDFWTPGEWTFQVTDERELGRLVGKLRDLGVVFPDIPNEWDSPAATFEDLRKRGLVEGAYTASINYGHRVEMKQR